ncbi:zinc finger matrin-type protein CG9776 [Aedes albopictus]|uniref:U1-type domain-containing protein n=1 Tax=Aedes albopictus TaxID=7160 RepID=A0ABM1XVL4_AEDAL
MDDKRDGKKKDKKSRKSRSVSRDNRRSPSRSPSYSRRRRDRSRSRDRMRRRSPSPPPMRRRGRGRRSPSRSPPPPPPMQVAPPPPMIGNPAAVAASAYMGAAPPMYDAYGGYVVPPPPPPAYMGDMGAGYGGYDYGAPQGGPPPPVDAYGGMMTAPGSMMIGQPGPPGAEYGATGWAVQETEEEKRKREAAIALEVRNQRASLKKQRDDYRRRASALKRELKTLKEQRSDLCSGRDPPSPTTNSFVKENDKLQSQIQSKISTIENVIDMLDGIIGKDKSPTPPPPPMSEGGGDGSGAARGDSVKKGSRSPSKERSSKPARSESGSPERLKKEVLQTMKRKDKKDEKPGVKTDPNETDSKRKPQFNYIYYDPELHWCSVCDIFPKTAKEYLNHLHSEQHRSRLTGEVSKDFPWREKQTPEDMAKTDPDLPSKRTPIRGLQFFVPATAWYCKICDYWMGDLPSASAHLKSQKHGDNYTDYLDSHTNFEIDWMSDRQKAYEKMRDTDRQQQQASTTTTDDATPAAVLPVVGGGDVDFLTGSSLQKSSTESSEGKKRKKSKEEKKEKKKKKRSKKKKKRAVSSSSSSSSSSSDSDSDQKSTKGDGFDPATSIRVAMRNLLKAQEAAKDAQQTHQPEESTAGKWTVVQTASVPKELAAPPPPFMTDGAESREKKRDELMISQWVTPDPIISESEKKLLEQLKGKLKKRDDGPSGSGRHHDDRSEDSHSRRSKSKTPPWRRGSPGRRGNSRSPVRRSSRSPIRRGGFRRSPIDRRRDRDFDRGRFDRRRRSRSRGRRSPSYGRGRFRMRRSYSRSRSRSRSRGRRVIEKPIVNFPPEPKPKPEKKIKEKKDEDKKEKKPVTLAIGQKKLPFIGRMPVFKKQQQEAKKEEAAPAEKATGKASVSVENGTKHIPEEFVDMMPDPYQYVALMGAPPPPPAHPSKPDSILPPGIDEAEADLVPKPISDAPIPRKGPLPKDFQEALDILFDGDKPKPAELIASETKPPELMPPIPVVPIMDTDQPQMIVPEAIEIYNQQIAAQYSSAVVSAPAIAYDDESQNQPLEMGSNADHSSDSLPPVRAEGSPPLPPSSENDDGSGGSEPIPQAPPPPEIENEETRRKRAELEELAMLGIDADDMAAQIF